MINVNPQEIDVEVISDEEIKKIGENAFSGRELTKEEQDYRNFLTTELNSPKDESIQKLIFKLSKEILETEKEDRDADEIARLQEVAKAYNGDDRILPFAEIYEEVKQENTESSPLIKTGFTSLDNIIKKFKTKHLMALGGITKHGKTTFCMDLTTKMKEWNPLWLPIEEGADELMDKFIDRNEPAPHGFSPKSVGADVTTQWCELKIVEGKVKYGTKLVFIDNLDWIKPIGSTQNDSKPDRITQSVKELKAIARKWNVAIILLVHVNKNSKADLNPTFEDIKGSSGVAQTVDKVILLWRETKRGKTGELEITNNTNISVQANRQGGVGNVKMVFDNGHYFEKDWVAERENACFGTYADL